MSESDEAMDAFEDAQAGLPHTVSPMCNQHLARAIQRVQDLHEATNKPYLDCIREVVGNDPLATILDCLFTVCYCDMFDFCDRVLGPEDEP